VSGPAPILYDSREILAALRLLSQIRIYVLLSFLCLDISMKEFEVEYGKNVQNVQIRHFLRPAHGQSLISSPYFCRYAMVNVR